MKTGVRLLKPKKIENMSDSSHQGAEKFAALKRKKVPILSPLRYPGSKRRLAGYIKRVLELNKLHPRLLIEPFAGGASVSLQLLAWDAVERAIIADIDPLVAAFWRVVFWDTDWLVDQVLRVPVTLEKWYEFKHSRPQTDREKALVCLFLNRTSFSGILAPSAGPIGGIRGESSYSLGCRFPRERLVERIRRASSLRDRVIVEEVSWEQIVGNGLHGENVFYYFDPPFFEKGSKLYTYYFRDEDHWRFRDVVVALHHPWLLSYDASLSVLKLYGDTGLKIHTIESLYSTSNRRGVYRAREVILTNLPQLPEETRIWCTSKEWKKLEPQGW